MNARDSQILAAHARRMVAGDPQRRASEAPTLDKAREMDARMSESDSRLFMVFDVESVGLHGEGFQWGMVVVDRTGREIAEGRSQCFPEHAAGDDSGRAWVLENVPFFHCLDSYRPCHVRESFWVAWQEWKAKGATLWAECLWPVEARFLASCVDDDPAGRAFSGPYPFHDIATLRLAAGLDPLAAVDRLPSELPVHDPLADSRQSARLLIEALNVLQGKV